MKRIGIRAQRSVEVVLTLGSQEAADLAGLLADAAAAARGTELEGFYEDLRFAIVEGLVDEGVTLAQPRIIGRERDAPEGGTLFAPGRGAPPAIVVPVVPIPKPDPEAKTQVFDAREASTMEPRQGLKPVFK